MSEWLALAEVAVERAGGALDARPVAWHGDTLATRQDFLLRVAAWQAAFAAAPGTRYALYFDDGYEFSTALYGAWHAGKEVYLPGDAQAANQNRRRHRLAVGFRFETRQSAARAEPETAVFFAEGEGD